MPYYSRIILNSFYNRLFPKLFRHNRRMPIYILQEKTLLEVFIYGKNNPSLEELINCNHIILRLYHMGVGAGPAGPDHFYSR